MTRILACGDLHLGQGVERYGPDRLRDQELVWDEVAHIAYRENVDLVCFAGDAFERRRYPSQAELVAFEDGLDRLHSYGIPVVSVAGNHDVLAPDLPSSLRVFSHRMTVAETPQVVRVAGVAVACLPWTPISRLVAHRNGGDRDALYQEAAALLLSTLRGLRAEIEEGERAVLLAHWSASGAVTPTGREVGLDFGVVLDTAEVEAMDWDAVVLGHIHRAQFLGGGHDDFAAATPIFYTGSPLPLNHGEAGDKHGVWVFSLDEAGASVPKFVPIESRRFVTVEFDFAEECGGDLELIDDELVRDVLIAGEEFNGAIVRARYRLTEAQARRISVSRVEELLRDAGASCGKAEPEILREDRARVQVDPDALTELDQFRLYLDVNGMNGDRGALMVERTQRYLEAKP